MDLKEYAKVNMVKHHCGGCELPDDVMQQLINAEADRVAKVKGAPTQRMMCEWLQEEGYGTVSRTSLGSWIQAHG